MQAYQMLHTAKGQCRSPLRYLASRTSPEQKILETVNSRLSNIMAQVCLP